MIKYTVKNNNILKDGHTMFLEDVARELNRKEYLEEQILLLKARVTNEKSNTKTHKPS